MAFFDVLCSRRWEGRARELSTSSAGVYLKKNFNAEEATARGLKNMEQRLTSSGFCEGGGRIMRLIFGCFRSTINCAFFLDDCKIVGFYFFPIDP